MPRGMLDLDLYYTASPVCACAQIDATQLTSSEQSKVESVATEPHFPDTKSIRHDLGESSQRVMWSEENACPA
jgi:hypothetical protein